MKTPTLLLLFPALLCAQTYRPVGIVPPGTTDETRIETPEVSGPTAKAFAASYRRKIDPAYTKAYPGRHIILTAVLNETSYFPGENSADNWSLYEATGSAARPLISLAQRDSQNRPTVSIDVPGAAQNGDTYTILYQNSSTQLWATAMISVAVGSWCEPGSQPRSGRIASVTPCDPEDKRAQLIVTPGKSFVPAGSDTVLSLVGVPEMDLVNIRWDIISNPGWAIRLAMTTPHGAWVTVEPSAPNGSWALVRAYNIVTQDIGYAQIYVGNPKILSCPAGYQKSNAPNSNVCTSKAQPSVASVITFCGIFGNTGVHTGGIELSGFYLQPTNGPNNECPWSTANQVVAIDCNYSDLARCDLGGDFAGFRKQQCGYYGSNGSIVATGTPGMMATPADPFGVLDTWYSASQPMTGSVFMSGWALAQGTLASVDLWRDPTPNEGSFPIWVQALPTAPGYRTDVGAAYPTLPYRNDGGFGGQVLTNMLPNSDGSAGHGDGTWHFYVLATDMLLRQKIVDDTFLTGANSTATLPFGTIDTPTPSEVVHYGSYAVQGWALAVPGSSVTAVKIFIDGVQVGVASYGDARSDITALFPGYNNAAGAGFHYVIPNTLALGYGRHNIAAQVTDNQGRVQGIGSRFFTVVN